MLGSSRPAWLAGCPGLLRRAAEEFRAAGIWAWDTLGRPVALLLLEAVALSALTLALDWDSRHHAVERCQAAARRRAHRRGSPSTALAPGPSL